MRGGGTAADSALAAGHSQVPESLSPRTWVGMGAWPVRGLLAPPVQGFVYITRLIFYLYQEMIMRLPLALLPHALDEAFFNLCSLVDHLRYLQIGAMNIGHAAYNSCNELHHGLVEAHGLHVCLLHEVGPHLQGR